MSGRNKRLRSAVSILAILVLFVSCSDSDTVQKSLMLSLKSQQNGYEVSAYERLNRPYQKSQQQGQYQAHLLDGSGKIIQKVSFGQLVFDAGGSNGGNIQLVLPLSRNLHQVKLYKLNGSSGHYQLDGSPPLLNWTLAEDIRRDKNS